MVLFGLIAVVISFAHAELSETIYTTLMVMLACFGHLNGFATSRYLKFFGNSDFRLSTTISALALPVFIIGVFFFEILLSYAQSSALRFSAAQILLRVIAWYLFNASTCFIGAYRGYTQKVTPVPSAINVVVRPIPA